MSSFVVAGLSTGSTTFVNSYRQDSLRVPDRFSAIVMLKFSVPKLQLESRTQYFLTILAKLSTTLNYLACRLGVKW